MFRPEKRTAGLRAGYSLEAPTVKQEKSCYCLEEQILKKQRISRKPGRPASAQFVLLKVFFDSKTSWYTFIPLFRRPWTACGLRPESLETSAWVLFCTKIINSHKIRFFDHLLRKGIKFLSNSYEVNRQWRRGFFSITVYNYLKSLFTHCYFPWTKNKPIINLK